MTQKRSFTVTGLTCGGCVSRVQNALSTFAYEVQVTLNPPIATLTQCQADISTLNVALSHIGNYSLTEDKSAPPAPISSVTNLETDHQSKITVYFPLLLIIGFIVMVSVAVQFSPMFDHQPFDFMQWMTHFMAGFFLVFSFFKLLNIRGFADSYAMYDVLAMRFKPYGYVYPFIELGLGLSYLLALQPMLTNTVTLLVMLFSSIGVIVSVAKRQKIRCACLGAVFNLPMSTITIIEDLLMAGMALWMLL
jgi:cation transport ATPase